LTLSLPRRPLRSSSPLRLASIRTSGPGLALVLLLWVVTIVRINYAAWVEESYGLWQSLGPQALQEYPLESLLVLHVQPPGLNILEAIDLRLTPDSHLLLAAVFLLMSMACLWMIVDTLLLCGLSTRAAMISGLIFAALPAAVIYSLWPFSTMPTMFAGAVALWGVARLRAQPFLGVSASAVGALLLLLTRSSFPWPFLLVWLAALVLLAWRQQHSWRALGREAVAVAVVALIGIGMQAHYIVAFGLPTMSSWTGENLGKALLASGRLTVTDAALSRVAEEPCEQAVLAAFRSGERVLWDPVGFRNLPECSSIPGLSAKGTPAWDSATKVDGAENFNWSERLVASRVWSSMMGKVVMDRPGQLVAMAVASPTGARESGIGIYLGPAEDYPGVAPIRDAYPLAQVTGLMSLLFAPGAIVLGLLGLVATIRRRPQPVFAMTMYFCTALVAYHIAVSTLVEYGENMRFQAEMTPALVLLGFLGLHALRQRG